MKKWSILICGILLVLAGCGANMEDTKMAEYQFPSEDAKHEGTWLTWPHHHTYGKEYREEIEPVWVKMADALHKGENVHIIAYDANEETRIANLLTAAGLDMGKVDFTIAKSDDVWSRDTGPMFVLDSRGRAFIADFGFDGWGGKASYKLDDAIPRAVAKAKGIPILSIPGFILEGGSVELDGSGTAMLCKSSAVSHNRNPDKTIAEAEAYLTQYLGAINFIWLEGALDEDITDAHIDGMARFLDDRTLLTVSEEDFYNLYEGIQEQDYNILHSAVNAKGEPYEVIELPMTDQNVQELDYKGSYLNYYIGNEVVLLPVYYDQNDAVAEDILSELYPDKEIVPIDVTALYQYGGMLHCVTQQQPEV